jgi:preprotein translocase subunit SecE
LESEGRGQCFCLNHLDFELSLLGAKVGRLQRKKSSTAKKKKKTKDFSKTSIQVKKNTAAILPDDSIKVIKKQKAVTAKKPLSVAKLTPAAHKSNILNKTIQFLREVKMELKKVTWPSRKQTLGSTAVVLILVSIIAFFLGAVDIGLSSLVRVVLQ